jgi:hypothetical protein
MPQAEFEPTIAVFERPKTVNALGRAATVICFVLLAVDNEHDESNEHEMGSECRTQGSMKTRNHISNIVVDWRRM